MYSYKYIHNFDFVIPIADEEHWIYDTNKFRFFTWVYCLFSIFMEYIGMKICSYWSIVKLTHNMG